MSNTTESDAPVHGTNDRGRALCGARGTFPVIKTTAPVTCKRCRATDAFDSRVTSEAFNARVIPPGRHLPAQ